MLNIGARALSLLNTSHGVTGRLRASINGGPFTYPVTMLDGSVAVTGNSEIRRKLTATIASHIDSPECDVFRTEIRAEYGIVLPTGGVIWIPQGIFVVTDAEESGPGQIAIKGTDRWLRIQNARFLQPVTTSGLHLDAIVQFARGADPRIQVQRLSSKTSRHNSSVWERDRDKAVSELAKSAAVDVFFNHIGELEIRDQVDIGSGVPNWNIAEGDGGALITSKRGRKQGNTYNAVVAQGEAPDGQPAVRAVAYVKDTKSPIFFGGPFAQRPKFYTSSLITTQAQAQAAADGMLNKAAGIAKVLSLESVPHPGLDAGDIITVEVQRGRYERHIVDAFTLPLGPGGISISTRTPNDDEEEGTA